MYAGGEIWALDPATKCGFARGEPGHDPLLSVINFRESRDDTSHHIFQRAVGFLAKALAAERPALIAIEQPVPVHNSEIAFGLQGIFIGIALCKNVPVLPAPIGTWRRYFLARGNLKGDEAKRQCIELCKQLGWDTHGSDDAAESAGIWTWACAQVAPKLCRRVEPLFLDALKGGRG